MLKFLAAAALTLVSIPAFADATGAGFCTSCRKELQPAPTNSPPRTAITARTRSRMSKASYASTKDEPSKALRAELANANAMWMDLAQQPTKIRLKGAGAAIEKSCVKLKKLDQ